MNRALAVLTCVALLTVVVEATDDTRPWLAVALGVTYAVHSLVAFPWLTRQPAPRRYWLTAGHVCLQLPLGALLFGAAQAGVGATLLLLVLVSQSVLLLPLPGAAAVTAVVPLVHLGMGWADFVRNGLGLLGAAVFTAVVTELLRREQRARAELAEANELLRGHAAQAEELATTRERNRLARDIHDGLGHHLTVVQMQVQAARAVLPTDPGRADEVLAKAQHQASEALAEVRRSVAALRDPAAAPALRAGLAALTAEVSAAGLPTTLEVVGPERRLPPESEESLFRSAQEGLTNVRKHAGATSARVTLTYAGDGTVRLAVRDDGRGLPASRDTGDRRTFGLLGLRERAARVGGRLTVESAPGEGTALLVEVPG
ncbi:sensor histidine kinase [Geodermatophilus sp. SYSU D00708]